MRTRFLASALALSCVAGLAFADPPSPSGAPAASQPAAPGSSVLTGPASGSGSLADVCAFFRGGVCCPPGCEVCGPPARFWASAEYLYWWTKGMNIPPLVTSGSATNAIPGALGQPGTSTLFGNNIDGEGHSGGRFNAGFWLNCCQTKGFEMNYFFLGSRTNSFITGGDGALGTPVIARPFVDVTNPAAPFQNSEIVAFPGVASGTVRVDSTSRLQGAAPNFLCNLCCSTCCNCCDKSCDSCCGSRKSSYCNGYRVDLIAGFNWMQLNDDVTVTENITVLPTAPPPLVPGTMFTVVDQFHTQNNFYGPQIGLQGWWWRNRFFVNARGLLAVGDNNQQVTRTGTTIITPPGGAPVVANGGLLVQPTNSGTVSRDLFSVIPQIGFNVGYQLTEHIWPFVGYTFLYWNNVARPGDQIDTGVNTAQVPRLGGTGALVGPARPASVVNETDFWAQGINVGVMVRY